MADNAIQANLISLTGHHVAVTLSPGLNGHPQFSYQDTVRQLVFRGEEIQLERTALGELVTVTLNATPDVGSTTFTLLLPSVLVRLGEPTHLQTDGITTLHRTPFAPHLDRGQQDSYTTTRLHGSASFVET